MPLMFCAIFSPQVGLLGCLFPVCASDSGYPDDHPENLIVSGLKPHSRQKYRIQIAGSPPKDLDAQVQIDVGLLLRPVSDPVCMFPCCPLHLGCMYMMTCLASWLIFQVYLNIIWHADTQIGVTQVNRVLAGIDNWTFDTFELDEVTGHRPLSTLGFALLKRQGIVDCLELDETKLARWAWQNIWMVWFSDLLK